MKCPSCGKNVRSKRQCAHCGYVFGASDVKSMASQTEEKTPKTVEEPTQKVTRSEKVDRPVKTAPLKEDKLKETSFKSLEEEGRVQHRPEPTFPEKDYHVTPKTPKKGFSLGKFIWNLVKLLLFVAIVFLLFMFGPQMFTAVKNVVTGKQEISEVMPKNLSDIVPSGLSGGDDTTASQNQADQATSDQASSAEKVTNEDKASDSTASKENDQASAIKLKDHKVNLDDYPVINIAFDFDGDLSEVTKDTFKFNLTSNGEAKEMSDEYSLIKEGKQLKLSFSDPSANLLSADAVKQTLKISAESLGFEDEISYELPSVKMDQETQDKFNNIITDNLADLGSVSAVVKSVDKETPVNFTYENATVDASNLINWFILDRVNEAYRDGELTPETIVKVNPGLIATKDEGEIATATEGTEYQMQNLVNLTIQNNDASAMNHVIQELGGANEFNLWLNESSYFATKMTKKLGYTEDGHLEGAVTSAQDLGRLMEALAKDDLVSKELDVAIKESLVNTPITEKFLQTEENAILNRYEITTDDADATAQYYAGVLETEAGKYVIALLVSDVTDAAATLPAMNQTIQDILAYLNEGAQDESTQASTEASEESQTEVTQTPEQTSQASDNQANTDTGNFGEIYKDENGEYAVQPVKGQQDPVLLPVIRDDNGNIVHVEWYFDQASQMYKY